MIACLRYCLKTLIPSTENGRKCHLHPDIIIYFIVSTTFFFYSPCIFFSCWWQNFAIKEGKIKRKERNHTELMCIIQLCSIMFHYLMCNDHNLIHLDHLSNIIRVFCFCFDSSCPGSLFLHLLLSCRWEIADMLLGGSLSREIILQLSKKHIFIIFSDYCIYFRFHLISYVERYDNFLFYKFCWNIPSIQIIHLTNITQISGKTCANKI